MKQALLEEFFIFQNHVHVPLQWVFIESRPEPCSPSPWVCVNMLERVKPVLFMLGQILLDILPENYKQESWAIIINQTDECVPFSVGNKSDL